MSAEASHSTPEPLTELQDLPPSAKLVAKVLEYEGEMTQSQLAESTLLPRRTVRNAITQLEENEHVESRFSFRDARKRIYTIVRSGPA